MFLGTHTPKVDDKGRVILPAKFRSGLADGVVLTKGQDRSLVLWPIAEFEAAAARIREASQSNASVRAYSRVLFSSAFDQVPDKQGRITVPPALRDYAGLER
ncbi:MAG: division/cell wall cluster transcriptional repressor MraZ, partial [Actinobacteria bacterium]|nr:division/cell wall cluster transcriptional repressor MraZ [Actinomycetota bacterium]